MELVSVRFLGCSTRVDRGFAATLAKVETALAAQHAAEAPGMKFSAWHGIRGVGGYRAHGGMHSKGRAVDLNYSRNGYAVCRTVTPRGTVFGGEAAAASLTGTRAAFIAACARACLLARVPCDLSARKFGESTGSVWDRWHVVSDAVASHFAPYYQTTDDYDAGDADVRDGVIVLFRSGGGRLRRRSPAPRGRDAYAVAAPHSQSREGHHGHSAGGRRRHVRCRRTALGCVRFRRCVFGRHHALR